MKIVCDACSAKYSIADEKVRGKVFKIRCKKCSNIIVVRGASSEAAPEQYDNKETKVFDYSGYDSPAAAAAGAGGDEAVWHVVIDQEQVGPMTAQEVSERFARGEIDSDTYIWKEGFGDWERMAAVEPFTQLAATGGPTVAHQPGGDAAAAMFGGDSGGMFGTEGEDNTAQSDPADLFAQATASAGADDDPGADLFSGGGGLGLSADPALAATMSSGDDGGLFAAAGGNGAAAAAEEADPALTGQRNENSVLFSLNNLASLASDSPKPAPSTSSSSPAAAPGTGSVPGAPAQEGSGLIDIRSMAQVYLGDNPQAAPASAGTGSADDLPVFSQPSFESASPVLMPTAAPAANNKMMVALIAAIGVLAVVAVILAIVVFTGDDEKPDTTVAAGDVTNPAAGTGSGDTPSDTAEAAKDTAGGDSDSAKPAEGTDPPGGDGTTPPPETAGTNPGGAIPAPVGKPKDKDKKSKDRDKKSRDRDKKPKDKKPPKVESPVPTSGKGGCDEVACLVDPDKACCKRRGGSSRRTQPSGGGGSDLPERLSRSDISKGIGKVRGRVASCGPKNNFKGKVSVKIKIGGDGRVRSASASGGTGSVRSCVTSAVKRAKFRRTQKGMSVKYPFVIR